MRVCGVSYVVVDVVGFDTTPSWLALVVMLMFFFNFNSDERVPGATQAMQ